MTRRIEPDEAKDQKKALKRAFVGAGLKLLSVPFATENAKQGK